VTFKEIPIKEIKIVKNIRSDPDGELGGLMDTIEKHGVLQPVLVIKRDGFYELVSGHRRLEAMKARNEATIPCIIHGDLYERDIPYVKLIENVQRKQLAAHELVEIFEAMKKEDPKLSNYKIGRMIGKTDNWVSLKYQTARIFNELFDQGVPQEALKDLNDSQLMRIGKIKNKKERVKIVKETPSQELNQTIKKAKSYETPKKRGTNPKPIGITQAGFAVVHEGTHNLIVLCKNKAISQELLCLLTREKLNRWQQYDVEHGKARAQWETCPEWIRDIVTHLNRIGVLRAPPEQWDNPCRGIRLLNCVAQEIEKVVMRRKDYI